MQLHVTTNAADHRLRAKSVPAWNRDAAAGFGAFALFGIVWPPPPFIALGDVSSASFEFIASLGVS